MPPEQASAESPARIRTTTPSVLVRALRLFAAFLLRAPGRDGVRPMAFVVGAAMVKDLLSFHVAYEAMDHPARFVDPYLPVPRIPTEGAGAWLAGGMQTAAFLGGFLLMTGRRLRLGAALGLACFGYAFVANRVAYTNNQYLLLVMLGWCLVATGRDRSVTRLATRLLQLFVASIYLVAGLTKLTPIWLSGQVLRDALYGYQAVYVRWIDVDRMPVFQVAAIGTVLLETALAFALFHPRARRFAIPLGIAFHVSIELLMPVRSFSYLMMGSYVLFAGTERRRALGALLDSVPVWARALAGLGAVWALNRFFVQVTYNYETITYSDVPVCAALVALAPIVAAQDEPPGPRRAGPIRGGRLAAVALALALVQGWLLAKPIFGRTTDFSFRIFTSLAAMRVETWVAYDDPTAGDAAFVKQKLWAAPRHWSDERLAWSWSGWVNERSFLASYAGWLARRIPGARRVRVVVHHTENEGPLVTDVFEATR